MNFINRLIGPGTSRGLRAITGTPLAEYQDLLVDSVGITPDPTNRSEIRHLAYRLRVRDHGQTEWMTRIKVVRFLRIVRMPVDVSIRKRSSEYDDQRDLVRALWMQKIHYVCVLGDTGAAGHGVLHLMGVQGVGETLAEAQTQADRHYASLSSQLTGTYPQIRFRALRPPEADWLLHTQQQWSHVLPIRGIPMPRRDAGQDLRTSVTSTTPATPDIEEGVEELIRGMLGGPGYLLVLMASPVTLSQITDRLSAAAEQLSTVASQVHGQRSISAGVGLPMMFSTATGDAHGTGHSFGVNDGASDSQSATQGTSRTATDGVSEATTHTTGRTRTDGVGITDTQGAQQGWSHSEGLTGGRNTTDGASRQDTQGISQGTSSGTNDAINQSVNQSTGHNQNVTVGKSGGISGGTTDTVSHGTSDTRGENSSRGISGGETRGENWSEGTSRSAGSSMSAVHGENSGRNLGGSLGVSLNTSSGTSDQIGYTAQHGASSSTSVGGNHGITASQSQTEGTSNSHGVNSSYANGVSRSANQGWSTTGSEGTSQQSGSSIGRTQGVTSGTSLTGTESTSLGTTNSVGNNRGWTEGVGENNGIQQSTANSRTHSVAQQESVSQQNGRSRSMADGVTNSLGHSLGDTYGRSDALSQSFARNSQTAGSLSFVPTLGMGASRQTLDAMADQVTKILTAQVNRLALGHEEGMWLSQGYMLVPDADTAASAAGLLTSSFWAPGQKTPVPQPFCVADNLTHTQSEHLVEHARVFSPCAHADLRPEVMEPHYYATALLSHEVAVLTTPPRIDVPGIAAAAAMRVPVLVFPQTGNTEIHLGHVVDTQRAVVSTERFGLTVTDHHNGLLHPLITGSTGRGKTETGIRLAHEWLHTTQTLTTINPDTGLPTPHQVSRGVLALDRKSDWRRLYHSLPADQRHRFRFYDLSREHPAGYQPTTGIPNPYLRYNLLRIPPGVAPNVFRDAICDTMAKVGQLGHRGRGILWQALNALWSQSRPDPDRGDTATVYERPTLSRFVGMADMAEWIDKHLESISRRATTSKDLVTGYNVIQNRLQFFQRGVFGAGIFLPDPPGTPASETLEIAELVGRGDCVIFEAAHLDAQMGAFVLAAIFTAVFAFARDNPGRLSETMVVLEEANDYLPHERDPDVSGVQQTVFDQCLSMGRSLGLALMLVVQSPENLSQQAINCAGLVAVHSADSYESKQRVMAKLGKDGRYDHRDLQQFLSEIPTGWAVIKRRPTRDWIEGAPVLVAIDAVDFPRPTDADLGLVG
ncbi:MULTISPECIES: serine-rich protein [unclassified Crossiella]|uniref:serine-rich protein n=1 Tax=unclassified Crossiella TaxID=2620835 RepID=UPI0020005397|nr:MULTISPECIES: serine-rich protein [unclassified Crossiella]MCK2240923.1 serine-rich protein [Crossiella sp. S99.2]MCK2253933.1 serine-rich protein [Crossiella sp. S99.1]